MSEPSRDPTGEDLRESQKFLDSIVENIPDMVFVKSAADLRFVRVNRAAERLIGYSDDDLRGKNDFDFFPVAEAEFFTRVDREVLQGGVVVDIPSEPLRTRGGQVRILHTKKIPILADDGTPRYLLGISEDITDALQAKKDLEDARIEVERASRAKTNFLSRMSHELRTPLNAILGFAQLLQAEGVAPDQQESVDHILRAARHLLGLINEVLDISRIESGRLSLTFEPVALDEVVAEAIDLIRPMAATRDVTLPPVGPTMVPMVVRADRRRLLQVVLNLAGNAVKYNRVGGRVEVVVLPAGAGRARIGIRDNGLGIARPMQAFVFRAFERVDADVSDIEGTGLGLPLAKYLVEAMGGSIGFDTEADVGTTFWIELALAGPATA